MTARLVVAVAEGKSSLLLLVVAVAWACSFAIAATHLKKYALTSGLET